MLKIVDGCGFRKWPDIVASAVGAWLGGERDRKSARTLNEYLTAFKGFARWMVQDRRAGESPVQHLQKYNDRVDRRHDRRNATPDELNELLQCTIAGRKRYGMLGADRAALYRLAAETGFRVSEIRGLTPRMFDLDGPEPTVTVVAGYSKRRREDVQPIRPAYATELRAYLAGRDPSRPVFNMPHECSMARMLRKDLADARAAWIERAGTDAERRGREAGAFLSYQDDADRYFDFHALRHSYITNLTNGGVYPKDAQILARHSTITLTMDRYSHVARAAVARALDVCRTCSGQATGNRVGQPERTVELCQICAIQLSARG